MKLFVVFFVALFAVINHAAADAHEQFNQNIQACLQQYNLEDSQFKSNSIPDDKKCFYKCLKEKGGMMNSAGEITVANFKTNNPNAPAKMIDAFEACAAASKKTDPCDTAKALTDCMRSKRPQM